MDNESFDNTMRALAVDALSDAYEFARDSKSLEGLVKTAELAGKMIDFTVPTNQAGFHQRGKNE